MTEPEDRVLIGGNGRSHRTARGTPRNTRGLGHGSGNGRKALGEVFREITFRRRCGEWRAPSLDVFGEFLFLECFIKPRLCKLDFEVNIHAHRLVAGKIFVAYAGELGARFRKLGLSVRYLFRCFGKLS